MPMVVRLENEFGSLIEQVDDSTNCLPGLLDKTEHFSFIMFRFIDLYGNTIFNRRQLGVLVKEIDHILKKTKASDELTLLEQIRRLAIYGSENVHVYLKFVGD